MPRSHLLVSLLLALAGTASAQTATTLDSATVASFRWRALGPANMMGRVTDVEGIPSPSRTFYVAAAAGGIWKTTNAGTTFQLVFGENGERVISMGDLAIAPSDTSVIYAGTGEEDSRNSISPGGGFFRSGDGGKTWEARGLEKTQVIARIVVHPTDPNTVWVAALGAIWNSNPERGLYKTTDGGKTWRLVKFISDKAGFVDLAMDPRDPNVLWAASWERVRGPYFLHSGGPGSGLWKSTDGGESWTAAKSGGLPESTLGRIGIGIAASNPDVMYLIVEADTMPNPRPAADAKQQERPSGLYRTADGGKTWEKVATQNVRPFYYSQVRVNPRNPDHVFWSSTPVNFSTDGGKTVRTATQGIHVDHHAMWIDPNDPNYFVVGNDGGVAISFDGGGNYIYPNTIPIGQFYNVSYDMAVPYNICGGLQDNGSWCGPSRRRSGAVTNAEWVTISGGDGFVTQQDPVDPNIIYSESQGGSIGRFDYSTGQRQGLGRPSWRNGYREWSEKIAAARGDTTRPMTAAVRRQVADLERQRTRDSLDLQLRFNWNTPFFISPHNRFTLYVGANRVLKSVKQGDEMFPISPDLTRADTMKIRVSTRTTGGITPDNTGAETYATIVSLAESPLRAGLLYAGTDDGRLWVTRNDGGSWQELTSNVRGVPDETYLSRIEPSHHAEGTVYLTFDNHRRGDFTPYVYRSTDYGATFQSISSNLPTGSADFAHVIREDHHNPDLLFVGTDVGLYVSLDRGGSWQRFMSGFPTVPVHDLQIHPRDGELIAGTHGRAIWVVGIRPLQQMNETVAAAKVHLFDPGTAWQLYDRPGGIMGGGAELGHMGFRTMSPPHGAEIIYQVAKGAPVGRARIAIMNTAGDTVRAFNGPGSPGLHRVNWNFQVTPERPALSSADSTRLDALLSRAIDSLVTAGAERPGLDSVKTNLLTGNFPGFGGGGGGGGAGGAQTPGIPTFRDRPGEGGEVRAGGGGGGFGGGAMGQLAQAFGGFRGLLNLLPEGMSPLGGGGGGQNQAEPGDYTVVVNVAGETLVTSVKVARARPNGGIAVGLP